MAFGGFVIFEFYLLDSVGNFAGGRRGEGVLAKMEQKFPKWKKLGRGWGNYSTVSFLGQKVGAVSLVSDFIFLIAVVILLAEDGKWEIMRKRTKSGQNGRNNGGVGFPSASSASVSIRGRRAAVVSLVSDFTFYTALVIL